MGITSTTETGLLGDGTPYSYTTTYQYDAKGRLAKIVGPRTDVSDVTIFEYDSNGNLINTTQPLMGTTTYANYDGLENPGSITDPNGNITTYTYDTLGRILTVTAPGDSSPTQYTYTTGGCASCGGATDKIASVTLPEGNILGYSYDPSGNLSSITDKLGNSINYTYDSAGNKLKEEIRDSNNALQKTLSYQYDALNRLTKTINPDNTYTQISYDSLGNRTAVIDPNGNSTAYQYDALSRYVAAMQPRNITTSYVYDTNDNLTKVIDANGNATVYKCDDIGRVYQVISPDTGTTTYSYDQVGNILSKTDANRITITYSYDALNRVTDIKFPSDPEIVYTYDTCMNGKGRICGMSDASGTTSYEYSAKGQVTKETKLIDGVTYVTNYAYNMNGSITSITYPSGRVVNYSNDAAGRVNGVATTLGTTTTSLAMNITYKPYGNINTLAYGNGLNRTITYDQQYRIASIVTAGIQNLSYVYDANSNITAITNNLDNTQNKTYSYDALSRLAGATGPWGSLAWTYDPIGNRLTQKDSAGTDVYSYQPKSNRLMGVAGTSTTTFTFDTNGNMATENTRSYTYNQNQRLMKAAEAISTLGEYVYNANGQRTTKTVSGVTSVFHFDQNGQLIAETNDSGSMLAEYVYLNGQPLAKIDSSGVNYILTDHLGTPLMMTSANGAKVWEIEARPFGESTSISGGANLNLRFPSQYFDAESGVHYNYFRDYEPRIGRYIETDPIGINGGRNHLYIYVGNNPVNRIDPFGLCPGDKKKCIDRFLRTNYGDFVANTAVPDFSLISFVTNFSDYVKTGIGALAIKAGLIYAPKGLAWVATQTGKNLMSYPGMIGAGEAALERGAFWATTAGTAEWIIAPAVIGMGAFSTTADLYARIACWDVEE